MVTIEQLYKDYEVLAEAGTDAGKHEKSYASILSAVGGDSPQKQLAGQFIPKFFKYFPSLAEQAINAQLDLCEDDVSMIRRQAIKELPNLCRDSADHLLRIADVLTQLLQSDDLPELNIVRSALMALYNIDSKGTLGGIFNQILSGEDKVRDRAIKFLSNKIQTLPPDRIPNNVEEFLVEKSKEVLADVTGEEFVIFMKLLTGLTSMQTLLGRKQLLDLVTEQADLTSDFQHTDSDSVDRLIQCIRQAMPFFSKNVQSTAFVSYICERVLPNLSSLASSPDENGATEEEKKDKEKESDSEGAKLEMLKLLAEMASNCGDLPDEPHTANLFSTLVEYMPLPPPAESEDSENTPASEGPQLQFSYVECLMYTFHQLARKHPEYLTSEEEVVAERLKDFRLRLQYFARGVQLYKRQLRLALEGKVGDQLKTDENKLKVVALRITSNIDLLTKDLFHNPPSYKSSVILSWRPVTKQPSSPKEQPGQKRSNITPITFPEGSPPAKKKQQNRGGGGGGGGGGQRRGNRGMYAPPSGKYSQKAGSAPGGGDANYGDNYGGNQRYQRGGYGRGRNRGRGRGRYY
ncbi:apoptosis inhibitor 5-like [Lytechinus pictus]|uniref:apoptosis inhibitor 5-like n=1 Tax=Lytechinus pictus TaxID=7653 RepID=UPI0030B9F2C3